MQRGTGVDEEGLSKELGTYFTQFRRFLIEGEGIEPLDQLIATEQKYLLGAGAELFTKKLREDYDSEDDETHASSLDDTDEVGRFAKWGRVTQRIHRFYNEPPHDVFAIMCLTLLPLGTARIKVEGNEAGIEQDCQDKEKGSEEAKDEGKESGSEVRPICDIAARWLRFHLDCQNKSEEILDGDGEPIGYRIIGQYITQLALAISDETVCYSSALRKWKERRAELLNKLVRLQEILIPAWALCPLYERSLQLVGGDSRGFIERAACRLLTRLINNYYTELEFYTPSVIRAVLMAFCPATTNMDSDVKCRIENIIEQLSGAGSWLISNVLLKELMFIKATCEGDQFWSREKLTHALGWVCWTEEFWEYLEPEDKEQLTQHILDVWEVVESDHVSRRIVQFIKCKRLEGETYPARVAVILLRKLMPRPEMKLTTLVARYIVKKKHGKLPLHTLTADAQELLADVKWIDEIEPTRKKGRSRTVEELMNGFDFFLRVNQYLPELLKLLDEKIVEGAKGLLTAQQTVGVLRLGWTASFFLFDVDAHIREALERVAHFALALIDDTDKGIRIAATNALNAIMSKQRKKPLKPELVNKIHNTLKSLIPIQNEGVKDRKRLAALVLRSCSAVPSGSKREELLAEFIPVLTSCVVVDEKEGIDPVTVTSVCKAFLQFFPNRRLCLLEDRDMDPFILQLGSMCYYIFTKIMELDTPPSRKQVTPLLTLFEQLFKAGLSAPTRWPQFLEFPKYFIQNYDPIIFFLLKPWLVAWKDLFAPPKAEAMVMAFVTRNLQPDAEAHIKRKKRTFYTGIDWQARMGNSFMVCMATTFSISREVVVASLPFVHSATPHLSDKATVGLGRHLLFILSAYAVHQTDALLECLSPEALVCILSSAVSNHLNFMITCDEEEKSVLSKGLPSLLQAFVERGSSEEVKRMVKPFLDQLPEILENYLGEPTDIGEYMRTDRLL